MGRQTTNIYTSSHSHPERRRYVQLPELQLLHLKAEFSQSGGAEGASLSNILENCHWTQPQ